MAGLTSDQIGVLALWNDCAPGDEEKYESWYQREHLLDRLKVPGFRVGRRYEAVDGTPQFFTYYETDTVDVLNSNVYLGQVNNPSPLTRTIMARTFINMNRTVCERVWCEGSMTTGYAVTVRAQDDADGVDDAGMRALTKDLDVARVEKWSSATPPSAPSTEENIRGGDEHIANCIVVHVLREEHARKLSRKLRLSLGNKTEIGFYRLLCELRPEAG